MPTEAATLQNYCLVKKIIAAVTPLKLCSVPLEQRLVLLVSSFTKGTARICH